MQNGEITCEPHFYIMNFDSKELFIEISRKYWAIENELHYIEDVTFGEDACKVRKDNGPSVLNVIVISLLLSTKNNKTAIKNIPSTIPIMIGNFLFFILTPFILIITLSNFITMKKTFIF